MLDREPAANWDARRAIGRAIRSARRFKGLTQEALGLRSLLSQSAISRIETGTVNGLRYQTLVRVLDALEVRDVELVIPRRTWFGEEWPVADEASAVSREPGCRD